MIYILLIYLIALTIIIYINSIRIAVGGPAPRRPIVFVRRLESDGRRRVAGSGSAPASGRRSARIGRAHRRAARLEISAAISKTLHAIVHVRLIRRTAARRIAHPLKIRRGVPIAMLAIAQMMIN